MAAFPTVKHYHDSFRQMDGSALRRTTMETGPAKQAKHQSRVLVTVKMRLAFYSKAEFDAFETWFKTDAKRGSIWFDWTHPRSGTLLQARFKAGEERGEAVHLRQLLDLIDQDITLEYWDS